MALACTICNTGNQGVAILTNLETGEAPVICGECFPDFILQIAQSLMESGYGVADELESHTDAPEVAEGREAYESATEAPEPDPTPVTPPNGRSRAKSTPAPTDTAESTVTDDEVVAASADL